MTKADKVFFRGNSQKMHATGDFHGIAAGGHKRSGNLANLFAISEKIKLVLHGRLPVKEYTPAKMSC
jgi:hypothetical protein